MSLMYRSRQGFLLLQVLVVVSLMAAWAALVAARAGASVHQSALMLDDVRARLALGVGLEAILDPPDLPILCLSGPLTGVRRRWTLPDGGAIEVRWRHLGAAVILAEIDASGPAGGRRRSLAWLTPDSVEQSPGAMRCTGSRLRPLSSGAVFPRPGE